jgi:hypothetical protein
MKKAMFMHALIASMSLLTCASIFAVDLELTDIKGNQVELSDASLSFVLVKPEAQDTDHCSGIPLKQGEGTVVIKWANIRSISFADIPNVLSLNMTVTLVDGSTRSMLVKREGRVVGKAKLGDFTIDLPKVKMIVIIDGTLHTLR